MPEDVIINFTIGENEVTPALEKLSKTGVDIKGFTNLSKNIKQAGNDTKGLVAEFKKVATTATAMGKTVEAAFGAGVQDALDEAGVSAEEFSAALTKANAPAKTLKQELKELKEALALAKVNGTDVGKTFDDMRARAGALSDAIADASAEIKNAGSDTRTFDNIAGSVSALAGGFSAVQGAAALFGDESEDLQKALLKVNAAMALATGLQQIQTAVQKEGSLAKLADSIATGAQVAVQRIYTAVTGQATAATVAFKVALAATGIGLFVVAVLALVSALSDTETSLEDVNRLLEQQGALLESNTGLIDRQTELSIARAKTAGAAETDLIKIRAQGLSRQFDAITAVNEGLAKERDAAKKTSKQYAELNKAIETNRERQVQINQELLLSQEAFRQAAQDEAKERREAAEDAAKKAKELSDKALAARKAAALAALNDELAILERRLLFAEKASAEELDLQKQIINKKRDIDLQGEKLTLNQVRLIRAKAYDERLKLDEAFNKRATEEQLTAQIQTNDAILAGIGVSNEKRLQLQIENLNTAAQLEINAAEGNATKILLIEAKKLADIRALKNASIDADLQAEIEGSQKNNDIIKAGLTKVIADTKAAVAVRIAAAEGIGRQELINVDKAIAANNAKEQSDEDYQKNYKRLAEERAAIEQGVTDKIAEIHKTANEQRNMDWQEAAGLAIEIGQQAADFFANLSSLASSQEQQRIEQQKRQLDELVEAGAITAKQAEIRAKQIEILERKAKQAQAQREKQAAVFNALLSIPSAALKGLVQGGPVLAAIYGALAAAQAALVIARPVPKFFRGKQPGTHEGKGIVADMGAEIVERNGRMFLYTKPTETHLGRYDKVHTAAQTRAILHSTSINTTQVQPQQVQPVEIDYDKMPKSNVNINIEKDFISEAVAEGLQMNRYFNKRYKF